MLRTITLLGMLVVLTLGRTGSAAADTSWLPRWLGGKSDEVSSTKKSKSSKPAKSKTANNKKNPNLFASTKDLFTPKKKRIISKYPSDRVQVSRSNDERPWYSRLFVPEETGPPRSVQEWMELEQIKP
jgi:hypothetical protein